MYVPGSRLGNYRSAGHFTGSVRKDLASVLIRLKKDE